MQRVQEYAPQLTVLTACFIFGVARASYYRSLVKDGMPEPGSVRPKHAIQQEEEKHILDVLHSESFIDKAPYEIFAQLLDQGIYLCSIRTMYRILERHQEVKERRQIARHPKYSKPELLATRVNEVWTWDITVLKSEIKGVFFYLYVMIDLFSRYVVGWLLADHQTAEYSQILIEETTQKYVLEPSELVIHSDNGKQMRAQSVGELLVDLGVAQSFSRPHVSNDNPYSESQFKTLKYQPTFPKRFGSLEDAKSFCRRYFDWYNTQHNHIGIGLLTPSTVFFGKAKEVIKERQKTLLRAYELHPERFPKGIPKPMQLPDAVWINKPEGK